MHYFEINIFRKFLVNKNKRVAAGFSICIVHHSKARDRDLVSQVLYNFYLSLASF